MGEPTTGAGKPSLTPELIAALWQAYEVALSPDGCHVAWAAGPHGQEGEHPERGIWVARLGDPAGGRRWTHCADNHSPRWSPDGARLAFLSDRAERGTAGAYVLHTGGGEARPVLTGKRSVAALTWSPDGRALAVASPDDPDAEDERRESERDDAAVHGEHFERHRLRRVDVDTGQVTTLTAPDLHVDSFAWSPDGAQLAVLAQPTPLEDDAARASLWILPAVADAAVPRRLADVPYARDLTWSSDATRLVYVQPHEAHPVSAWTAWAVRSDGGAEPVVIGPAMDEPRCVLGLRSVAGVDRVVLLVAEGLDSRLLWCDPATGGREVLHSADADIEAWDVVASAETPVVAMVTGRSAIEVWAGSPNALQQLSDHQADLRDVAVAVVEDFAFTAADGTALDGVILRPTDAHEGPAPTVVLLHGGPYGRSGRSLHCYPLDWGQMLATAGYAVVMPNYRGGLGHGQAFAVAARGGMGTVEWDDVQSAVDTAIAQGLADPDRLGIGGWSQGGFLTAWALTQTDRFAAGVMGAGVTHWGMLTLTSDMTAFEAALAGGAPWDGPGPHIWDGGSPLSYAAARTTPLLMLHGEDDERVPVTQARAFHRALRDQEAPVKLVTYPREPHGIRERRHQEDLQRRTLAWFDRWLKAR